ncbi:sugar ABC transporter ATP-binding protein (plasmid) [Azospirillum argentinense]|uniref:Sugar ABC transporter ATP-binding protein n=1 Tax=Azospirillum argentinense TaxID=2970906 RepID=A0A060DRE3_9PROT|nr:galactofuranose ABC transporter, ATP-binding protein YtfR [Azospirillum argentinense]AIB16396.1 sugar ABC transporter ATP-binding protein [Azospirillum argentinense]EZQ02467.1 sugar ABC transporter ATP-binding protein [Azospirillum argentinense]
MTDSTLTASPPLLAIRGLSKAFLGVQALDGVDFTVRHGEIHALLGENGAGKSTLIKTLTGVYQRDAGTVTLEGRAIAPRGVEEAQRLHIGTVYQEVNLLPNLSVAENLFLGRQPMRFGLVDRGAMRRRARAVLIPYGLTLDVTAPLGRFSVATQQIVAIARAVDMSAKVLILDEPTASLDAQEVAVLFKVMRTLRSRGIGIVFVTHFLDQVYALCDRITVLRNGRLVGERRTAELPRLDLVAMMLGRELEAAAHRIAPPADDGEEDARPPLVRFRGYGKARSVEPFDLAIRPGEVVGLAGLLGSGRTETARLVFGMDRADRGEAAVDGQAVRLRGPRDAIRLGFGFCPEDRKKEGIVGALSVRENIILALQARQGWLRPIPRRRQEEIADRFIRLLDIRTPHAEQPIQLLSGGNQQKALLARWLATEPRLLILDEPTRGIDVGAHAEIIRLIERLYADGMALLVVSSELEEIVAYSRRVVVLRDRRHVAELRGGEVAVDRIVAAIASESAPVEPRP